MSVVISWLACKMSHSCLIGIRSGEQEGRSVASRPSSSRKLTTHSGHMWPGIVLHQEEPRSHCTSARSDSHSEDFILVPLYSSLWHGGLCHPPRVTAKPVMLYDVTVIKMFTTASPLWNFDACHMCSVWTCSHLWRERGANGEHGTGVWAQVLLEDAGPYATLMGSVFEFGQKRARQ